MNAGRQNQTAQTAGLPAAIRPQHVLRFALYVLLPPVLLFLAAGTLDWPIGWAYVLLTIAFTLVGRLIMLRRNPELATERARYADGAGVKAWDKVIVPLLALYGPLLALIVAGLNHRLGWPPVLLLPVQIAGLVVITLGTALGNWALAVNRFFAAVVRIQTERGHTVVSSGPYRFVRHPAYAGAAATFLAVPLALGSLWALVPAVLTVCVLVLRTALEDRVLQEELPGYRDYTRRVHYRLVPGVW